MDNGAKKRVKKIGMILAAAIMAILTGLALCACQGGRSEAGVSAQTTDVAPPTAFQEAASTQDNEKIVSEALFRARARRIENIDAFLEREYRIQLDIDVSALLEQMRQIAEAEMGIVAVMEQIDLARATSDAANLAMTQAFERSVERLAEYIPATAAGKISTSEIALSLEGFTWASITAFVRGCVMTMRPDDCHALLEAAINVEADISYNDEKGAYGELRVSTRPFPRLWERACTLPQERLTGMTLYAYMATVYDENGVRRPYAEPEGAREALADIALPSVGTIRKTWYAARDGGRRLHTGTDIIAPEDTPIYACSAGRVTCISEGVGAGNLITVIDALGYEFHYYHLVRMVDFLEVGDNVARGQLVGNVGNTGNSDVNHLHLSVIAPNGEYVDAYEYLVAAKNRVGER